MESSSGSRKLNSIFKSRLKYDRICVKEVGAQISRKCQVEIQRE